MQHRIGNQHPLIQPTRIAHHYDANVAVQRTRSRQRVSQGSRPHMQQLPYKVELPHCPIPPELQLHLAQTQVEFFLLQRRPMRQAAQNYLTRMIQSGTVTLTLENFGVVLSSLLFVEEAEMQRNAAVRHHRPRAGAVRASFSSQADGTRTIGEAAQRAPERQSAPR